MGGQGSARVNWLLAGAHDKCRSPGCCTTCASVRWRQIQSTTIRGSAATRERDGVAHNACSVYSESAADTAHADARPSSIQAAFPWVRSPKRRVVVALDIAAMQDSACERTLGAGHPAAGDGAPGRQAGGSEGRHYCEGCPDAPAAASDALRRAPEIRARDRFDPKPRAA